MNITRSEVWRILQEHRSQNRFLGEGNDWKKSTQQVATLLAKDETLQLSQLSQILGIPESRVEAYLGNVRSRQWQGEKRSSGLKALFIFGVGVLLSFAMFLAFILSTPKEIDGEPAPLMEGKPKATTPLAPTN